MISKMSNTKYSREIYLDSTKLGKVDILKKKKMLLIIAGVGGHEAQATILRGKLNLFSESLSVEMIIEAASLNLHEDAHRILSSSYLTKKQSKLRFFPLLCVLVINIIQICMVVQKKKNNFDIALVTLGPFPAIPGYIASKISRLKFVSIESRSRFESLSATNRLLLKMGATVVVQHNNAESRSSNLKRLGVLM